MCIYIYICVYTYAYIHVYIYTHYIDYSLFSSIQIQSAEYVIIVSHGFPSVKI